MTVVVEAGASTTAAFTLLLVENVQRKYQGNWEGVYSNFTGFFFLRFYLKFTMKVLQFGLRNNQKK